MVKRKNKQGSTKKLVLLAIAGLLIAGGLLYWFLIRDDSPDPVTNAAPAQTNPEKLTEEEPVIDDSPEDPDPAKEEDEQTDNEGVPAVTKTPQVYTSAGHNASSPLPSGAPVSTTCTTNAGVKCRVTLTNQANASQVVSLGAKTTNSQGVAEWSWKAGRDVSSGTWAVVATAGSKSSAKELIYIE